MRGTIIRLIPARGFGFVRGDDGINRFIHARECAQGAWVFDFLREGETIEFEPYEGERGPRAKDVERVDTR